MIRVHRQVLKGGTLGALVGLVGGVAGVMAASKRSSTIRNLTLPMKSFLVTSSGTFVGIIAADHASRNFEMEHNVQMKWYQQHEHELQQAERAGMSTSERILDWARREKYKIVGATWVASMIGSFVLVGRNPYLSGQQKIVQARVYAQGLTLAVLVASAAFEISDQRKGRGILEAAKKKSKQAAQGVEHKTKDAALHPTINPERSEQGDLWKDMVAAEEQRMKAKHQSLYEHHDNNHQQHQHGRLKADTVMDPEEEKQHLKLENDLKAQKVQAEQQKSE